MVTAKTIEFINKAKRIHNDRYDYSCVEYVDNTTKVAIICHKHGEFFQAPVKHLRGQNCPSCAGSKKLTSDVFIKRANLVHCNRYNYDNVDYRNIDTAVDIICPKHGIFSQSPYTHLQGHGCKLCGNNNLTRDEFIQLSSVKYNNKYDYSMVNYINKKTHVTIICPKHGPFRQTPIKHLRPSTKGCLKCSIESNTNDTAYFIRKSNTIHNYKYDYSLADYTKTQEDITIICPKHGRFIQKAFTHLSGHGCPNCNVVTSAGHDDLIKQLPHDLEIIKNDRSVIAPYEIDIWIPQHRLGIEYHGYYWHGINSKTYHNRSRLRIRHRDKARAANDANITLLQIYDYEYHHKKDIILSMINHRLKMTNNVIYARKCHIQHTCPASFYEFNHIQGNRFAKHHIALIYGDEIVASMSFVKHTKYDYEIVRYCCKLDTSVVGGFSKCLKEFINRYNPQTIISFSDKRFSVGNVYQENGLKKIGSSAPNYKYCKNQLILSRNKCQKHKLQKLLGDKYNAEISEFANMIQSGYTQLFDAGNDKWLWTKNRI